MVHAFSFSLKKLFLLFIIFIVLDFTFPPTIVWRKPRTFFGNKMVQVWNKNTEILADSRVFYIYFRNAKYKIKFTTWLLT